MSRSFRDALLHGYMESFESPNLEFAAIKNAEGDEYAFLKNLIDKLGKRGFQSLMIKFFVKKGSLIPYETAVKYAARLSKFNYYGVAADILSITLNRFGLITLSQSVSVVSSSAQMAALGSTIAPGVGTAIGAVFGFCLSWFTQ